MTSLSNKLVFSRNNNSMPAFSRNNNNKFAFERNVGNVEIRFSSDSVKHAKKLRKLKDQKLAKSQKLSKLRKSKSEKLSKSKNLSNFDATKARVSFLTLNARTVFNRLLLAFTKTLILSHFYLECHI